MSIKSESTTNAVVAHERSRSLTDRATALAELERDFTDFRAQASRGTRIPDAIRARVVAALKEGVSMTSLRRRCGVTREQVIAWQRSPRGGAVRPTRATPEVRVFDVADDARSATTRQAGTDEQPLELRLGPWSISVRLIEPAVAGRG
jgi:hypothetical protein